jgi:hypothetical protein
MRTYGPQGREEEEEYTSRTAVALEGERGAHTSVIIPVTGIHSDAAKELR